MTIAVGTKVRLRGCRHGEPGTIIRMEHRRAVVLWNDLDYLARHRLHSLIEAEPEAALAKNSAGASPFEDE